VPVGAVASRSRPARSGGSAWTCTGVKAACPKAARSAGFSPHPAAAAAATSA
jgi:hypothetical protein